MSKSYQRGHTILIIDDHPPVCDFFTSCIKQYYESPVVVNIAHTAKEATLLIESYREARSLDIAIIDIQIPGYKEYKDGSDIAIKIRQLFPTCKIVICTALTNPLTTYLLHTKIELDAVLCKADANLELVLEMFENLAIGKKLVSNTIKRAFMDINIARYNFDTIDFAIIHHLARGYKTKEIPSLIGCSLSTVEKRKARMKAVLLKNDSSDQQLLEECKKMGIIFKP